MDDGRGVHRFAATGRYLLRYTSAEAVDAAASHAQPTIGFGRSDLGSRYHALVARVREVGRRHPEKKISMAGLRWWLVIIVVLAAVAVFMLNAASLAAAVRSLRLWTIHRTWPEAL